VVATSSMPGRRLTRTSAFLTDRLALVPITSPESVTRLRVLREGRTVVDTIPAFVAWNPLDTACAPVDGRLHLMLADDRRYSSVAGLAPAGTTSVRLYWRSGDDSAVSEVPVTTTDGVTAFVDSSGRRPDHLVRAEATQAGDVIGTVLPPT
ncbi:MAG: hypothetical protein LH603_02070, partial [Pseudonocardia sp.]|nr:hypothetical protein [Pseudonocardia sp.]